MSSALLKVIRSLSFTNDRTAELRGLSDTDWKELLPLLDRSLLTLPLGVRNLPHLPDWVQARIGRDLVNNAERHERIVKTYQTVAEALSAAGIEFVVLKGLTHWPLYCDDLRHRPQYDLDLYCPAHAIQLAYNAVSALGYEPAEDRGGTALDHLPSMIRKTGWRTKNDYYDPDMPLTIELHFRLWDPGTERFDLPESSDFWARRQTRKIGELTIPALRPVDELSYAAWHLMRHLVRGDLRACHLYEIAHFLNRTVADDVFWIDWRDCHAARPEPLIETIAFRLATEWFECDAHPVVRDLMATLPSPVKHWFNLFAFSPALAFERPNKDELFLHFCLVKGTRDRLRIAKRRLLPLRASKYVADAHVSSPDLLLRWKRRAFRIWFTAQRLCHHVRTLAPTMRSGLRWRRALAK